MRAPEAGAKLAQELVYQSPEWAVRYATPRDTIEGSDGFVKEGSKEALDEPELRWAHGVAAQSITKTGACDRSAVIRYANEHNLV